MIYIFEPSKYWDYCGGALVVSAPTFDIAVAYLREHTLDHIEFPEPYRHPFKDAKFIKAELPECPRDTMASVDCWLLTYALQSIDAPEGVLVANWNYA